MPCVIFFPLTNVFRGSRKVPITKNVDFQTVICHGITEIVIEEVLFSIQKILLLTHLLFVLGSTQGLHAGSPSLSICCHVLSSAEVHLHSFTSFSTGRLHVSFDLPLFLFPAGVHLMAIFWIDVATTHTVDMPDPFPSSHLRER